MRHVNWWFVGGAIVTLILAIFFGVLWNYSTVSAAMSMWGLIIVGNYLDNRRFNAERKKAPQMTWWFDPAASIGLTCLSLGVGLTLSALISSTFYADGDLTPPAITGLTLLGVALTVVAFLAVYILVRRRRTRGVAILESESV